MQMNRQKQIEGVVLMRNLKLFLEFTFEGNKDRKQGWENCGTFNPGPPDLMKL